jgi:hypothetical protein
MGQNPLITGARHRSLSWATWIQSTSSHPIYLRSILILSSHPRPGMAKWPFRLSNQNSACISHMSHAYYMPRSCHSPWFITLLISDEEYRLWSSTFCKLLQPPLEHKCSPQMLLIADINTDFTQDKTITGDVERLSLSHRVWVVKWESESSGSG